MRLDPVLVTAPAAEPIALADVKAHLRMPEVTDHDDLLEALIDAAIAHLDGFTGILGRCLIDQTWRESWNDFPSDCIPLSLAPVSSVTYVKYYDTSNVQQTYSAANYSLHKRAGTYHVVLADGAVRPAVYARPDAVQITYVAGYGAAASAVPAAIVHALKLHVERLFEGANWPDASAHIAAEQALLLPFRRIEGC